MTDAELYRDLVYRYEVLRARLGIREHYLKTIVKEVYENIGQVLSLVRVQLSLLDAGSGEEGKEKIDSSGQLVGSAIRDLRHLCRRFEPEADISRTTGFNEAIVREIKAIYPGANFLVQASGPLPATIGKERSWILFNLLLEILDLLGKDNDWCLLEVILLYKPKSIEVELLYTGESLKKDSLKCEDNGDLSILKRVKLMSGSLRLNEEEDQKRKIKLVIPIN